MSRVRFCARTYIFAMGVLAVAGALDALGPRAQMLVVASFFAALFLSME